MRLLHAILLVLPVVTPLACTSVRNDEGEGKPAHESVSAEVADPMIDLGRLIGGEWVMTATSGTSMYSTSHWGPGRHSVRTMTHGFAADGSPWRELEVAYWDPGRNEVRTLGLSPFANGVSEGVITARENGWEAIDDLYQTGVHRRVIWRVNFEGPDSFRSELLERTAPDTIVPLTSWEITRSTTLAPMSPLPESAALDIPEPLQPLKPLLGRTWQTTGFQTTLEWVPLAAGIYARVIRTGHSGEPEHLIDAYLYHHTGSNAVRCLALSSGGVYEGDLTVRDDGSLRLDLQGDEGGHTLQRTVRIEFESDGTLRQRVWSAPNTEGTPLLDLRHTALVPAPTPTASAPPDPYFMPLSGKTSPLMPRVIIRNIREDRAGNIWFATFGGPIRYDGATFTSFGEEVGLANRRIFSLLEDRTGALWFGSITGGASRYDGHSFNRFTETDGLGNNDVTWIFEDRDGNIWLGTGNGATRYDGKSMVNFTTDDGLVDNAVYAIAQDEAGRIWFGTQGGVCSYDGTSFSNLADRVGRSFANVRAVLTDRSGNVWFGGQQGAFRYNGTTLTSYRSTAVPLANDGLLEDFVGSMILDRAGNIWFGHPGASREGLGGGASRFDGTSFTHFTKEDGLNSTNVYCMLEDRAGNIWFGSVDAGACRYDGKTFTNFSAPTREHGRSRP
ncbi:MAG: hypothetical protein JNL80_13805 [Phycisphaerae bacterium]|jgi:streptogramin lyase|nr:hypothetical protein [Phycisphaerae bacterium]